MNVFCHRGEVQNHFSPDVTPLTVICLSQVLLILDGENNPISCYHGGHILMYPEDFKTLLAMIALLPVQSSAQKFIVFIDTSKNA